MNAVRDGLLVAGKDLKLLMRGRGGLVPVLTFGALVVLVLAFALSTAVSRSAVGGAGILWVVLFLGGELSLSAAWRVERENAALEGYLVSPADALGLFVGKLVVGVGMVAALAAISLPLYLLFFAGMAPHQPFELAGSVLLGGIGLVGSGLLLGTLGGAARGVEGLLPLILFPVAVPDLLASVATTQSAFSGGPAGPWWRVLIGYDILFLALATALFEASIEA